MSYTAIQEAAKAQLLNLQPVICSLAAARELKTGCVQTANPGYYRSSFGLIRMTLVKGPGRKTDRVRISLIKTEPSAILSPREQAIRNCKAIEL